MTQPARGLNALIRDKAFGLGFDAIGFCEASLGREARVRLCEFLAAGRHGTMDWLQARADQRADPRLLWPEVRSVISLGLSYAPEGDALSTLALREAGNISVYARNRDYHDVVKGMLKHLAQFIVSACGTSGAPEVKVFVDTAPVMEKPLAQKAQLGWQGKHTNLVSRQHGSWLFLGEIYTTLSLEPSDATGGGCGSCTRCLTACPTDAFPAPYQMDARRCISYLTIEHAGPIAEEFRTRIGNRIYGCDDCLAVCPWNRFARTGHHTKLQARDDLSAPALADLAQLDDAAFRARFSGSPVKRIGRNRFVRNVMIAVGNSRSPALREAAQALCDDDDPVVADAARWASMRLDTPA